MSEMKRKLQEIYDRDYIRQLKEEKAMKQKVDEYIRKYFCGGERYIRPEELK